MQKVVKTKFFYCWQTKIKNNLIFMKHHPSRASVQKDPETIPTITGIALLVFVLCMAVSICMITARTAEIEDNYSSNEWATNLPKQTKPKVLGEITPNLTGGYSEKISAVPTKYNTDKATWTVRVNFKTPVKVPGSLYRSIMVNNEPTNTTLIRYSVRGEFYYDDSNLAGGTTYKYTLMSTTYGKGSEVDRVYVEIPAGVDTTNYAKPEQILKTPAKTEQATTNAVASVVDASGLKVEQTGIPGSVIVSWTTDNYGPGYIIAHRQSGTNDAPTYTFALHPDSIEKLRQIYNLVDGVSYDFQVFKQGTGLYWHTDVPFVTLTPVAKDLTNEQLLFIIPKSIADKTNYQSVIASYVQSINAMYSTTKKQYTLSEIKIYDDSNCKSESSTDSDPCKTQTRGDLSKPYTLPIIFQRHAQGYTGYVNDGVSNSPRLMVKMVYIPEAFSLEEMFPVNTTGFNYIQKVTTMAHELGHTYTAGNPELYWYDGQDNTGVTPIVRDAYQTHGTHLPERFWLDPMAQRINSLNQRFSPLSAALINRNASDHKEYVSPNTESSAYINNLPPVQIKITGSNGGGVSGAQVKEYCIRSYFTNDGASKLLSSGVTDSNGLFQLVGPNTRYTSQEPGCFVTAIKVYVSGQNPQYLTYTSAERQEAKIVYNQPIVTLSLQFAVNGNTTIKPAINSGGVKNSADYSQKIAPGSIVSIFGTNLTSNCTQNATNLPVPTTLCNTQVKVNGTAVQIFYASPAQINFYLPQISGNSATISVENSTLGTSATETFALDSFGLGIYTQNQQGTGLGSIQEYPTYRQISSAEPTSPGKIIIIYATGGSIEKPDLYIGNYKLPAGNIQYYGPNDYLGQRQINVLLPTNVTVPTGNTNQMLKFCKVGTSQCSNIVDLPINKNAPVSSPTTPTAESAGTSTTTYAFTKQPVAYCTSKPSCAVNMSWIAPKNAKSFDISLVEVNSSTGYEGNLGTFSTSFTCPNSTDTYLSCNISVPVGEALKNGTFIVKMRETMNNKIILSTDSVKIERY